MTEVTTMTIRELLEAREDDWLAPAATRARGAFRRLAEDESDLRTAFQRDRDRIVHSKPFRRLSARPRSSSPRLATTTAPA